MRRYVSVMLLGMASAAPASPLLLGEAPGADCVAPRLYAPAQMPPSAPLPWYAALEPDEPLDARCQTDPSACPVAFFTSRCNEAGEPHYLAINGTVVVVQRVPGSLQEAYFGEFAGDRTRLWVRPLPPAWAPPAWDDEQAHGTLSAAVPVQVEIHHQGQVLHVTALYDSSP